ncbi:MAG: hypothetical protein ABI895_26770 [Deltaproteobacteria bacterium]
MVHTGWCVAVSGGLLASALPVASAAELVAHGPAECADTAELSFNVERSVGMPLGSAAPLRFEVVFERAVPGYSARVSVVDAGGSRAKERQLHAENCEQLADAVSVAVAIALGAAEARSAPSGLPDPVPTSAAPGPAPAPRESVVPSASDGNSTSVVRVATPASWLPSLSLWGLADVGSLPAPSFGAALGAELGWRRWQLRALGTLLFEQHTTLESPLTPPPGADLGLLTGSLLACGSPFGILARGVSGLACLGLELGRLAGAGTDVLAARQGSSLWLAPRLDLGATWSVPNSALRLGATFTVLAPLNRDEFELTGIGSVYQPPSVVGRLSFGIGLGFE